MNKEIDSAALSPSPMLVDLDRANDTMRRHGIDLLIGSRDSNLYYLSGHAPDSVLNHFFDTWSGCTFAAQSGPTALFDHLGIRCRVSGNASHLDAGSASLR
jgi:hypothetical protein